MTECQSAASQPCQDTDHLAMDVLDVHDLAIGSIDRQIDRYMDIKNYSARSNVDRPSVHYVVNKITMRMLNCRSESLANGEKQSERLWCVEMVVDCSKRPDYKLQTHVVPVQCAYVE